MILENLRYNIKTKIWENGKIHDPNSKNVYKAIVKIISGGKLEVHGYTNLKFIGIKKNFRKVN